MVKYSDLPKGKCFNCGVALTRQTDVGACLKCIKIFEHKQQAKELKELADTGIANGWLLPGFGPHPLDAQIVKRNPQAYADAKAWFSGECINENLFICGPNGTGKTYLARYCTWNVYARTRSVSECLSEELLKELTRFEPNATKKTKWYYSRLLLIDDLGNCSMDERRIITLLNLINIRSLSGAITIITSNWKQKALIEYFSAAMSSNEVSVIGLFERLIPCLTIELSGESIRRERNRKS